jgi:hypothetical protein
MQRFTEQETVLPDKGRPSFRQVHDIDAIWEVEAQIEGHLKAGM